MYLQDLDELGGFDPKHENYVPDHNVIREINIQLASMKASPANEVFRNLDDLVIAYHDNDGKDHPVGYSEDSKIIPKPFICLCKESLNLLKKGKVTFNQKLHITLMAEME